MPSLHNLKLGSFLGFPDCCIAQFNHDLCAETAANWESSKWAGSGFVPCSCCAPAVEKDFNGFIAEHIQPNRLAPAPFPSRIPGLYESAEWKAYERFFDNSVAAGAIRTPSALRRAYRAFQRQSSAT